VRLSPEASKLDPKTSEELRKQMPAQRLKLTAVLDFFGGMFEIRDGKPSFPAGSPHEKAWGELAGVEPSKGAAFYERLLSRGRLAGQLLDALARIEGRCGDYSPIGSPERFYAAIRGRVTSPGPAAAVFHPTRHAVADHGA